MSKTRKLIEDNHEIIETKHQEITESEAQRLAILGADLPDKNPPPSPFHVWDGKNWLFRSEHEKNMLQSMSDVIPEDDYSNQLKEVKKRNLKEKELYSDWMSQNAIN